MFDLYKQYRHIKQIGLEIDKKRAAVARKLIKVSPAKDTIKIITIDCIDFDYSWMTQDDFVFISVDVNGEHIYKKVLETSADNDFPDFINNIFWLFRKLLS